MKITKQHIWGLLAVLICTGWTLWKTTKFSYDLAPANTLRYEWQEMSTGKQWDSDARLILRGVENKSFVETFAFWTGTWALEQNKFFRPVPSMLWWMMYHTLGDNLAAFLIVLALSHLIATLVLWRFLCYLFRSELSGTLATCCFASGIALNLFGWATPAYALELWIDHVEPWFMVPYVLTCWAFVKYSREGGKWLCASLVLFVVTICTKEPAYTLPVMAAALLWHEGQLARWKTLLPFGAVAVLGLAYRTWALQGTGTKFGSNDSWKQRAFTEMGGGMPAALLNAHDALPFVVATAIMVGVLWFAKRRRHAAFFAGVGVLSLALAAHWGSGLDDPFYYDLLGNDRAWLYGFNVALWMGVIYLLVTKPTKQSTFGVMWVFITYSVLLFSPTTPHTLYLTSVGYGIMLGAMALKLLPHVSTVRLQCRDRSMKGELREEMNHA